MKKKVLALLISTFVMLNVALPVLADTTTVDTSGSTGTSVSDSTAPASTSTDSTTVDSTSTGSTATNVTSTDATSTDATSSDTVGTPRILPDSPFYFLDKLFEQIVLVFTFSPEKKAQTLVNDANERLAEAKVMSEQGKQDLANQCVQAYLANIEKAQVVITLALNDGKLTGSVSSTVYGKVYDSGNSSPVVNVVYGLDISQKHAAQVLVRVLAKAPEQARKGLMNALMNVLKHQEDQDAVIAVMFNMPQGMHDQERDDAQQQGHLKKQENDKAQDKKKEQRQDMSTNAATVQTVQGTQNQSSPGNSAATGKQNQGQMRHNGQQNQSENTQGERVMPWQTNPNVNAPATEKHQFEMRDSERGDR